jgi:hypothetical protein
MTPQQILDALGPIYYKVTLQGLGDFQGEFLGGLMNNNNAAKPKSATQAAPQSATQAAEWTPVSGHCETMILEVEMQRILEADGSVGAGNPRIHRLEMYAAPNPKELKDWVELNIWGETKKRFATSCYLKIQFSPNGQDFTYDGKWITVGPLSSTAVCPRIHDVKLPDDAKFLKNFLKE